MTDYDVVVAGGGPAGLQFAREVGERSDHSVVVLESNDELSDNDKSTGGTFHQVVEGYDVPDDVLMAETPGIIFEGPTTAERLAIPNYVLDFPAFLEYLGEETVGYGVDIRTGRRVTGPLLEDGVVRGVEYRAGGEREILTAKVVVDATGPDGVLTTELGMWNADRAQRGIGKEYEVVGEFACERMLFRFDHKFAPGGYAWVFPAGDERFKIGVCWVDEFYEANGPDDDRGIDAYIRDWITSDDRWEVRDRRAVHAGQALSDNSMNRRAADGIVAVGDSVSSINPLFGEGIRPAMESAEMAADAVLDALESDDTSREQLSDYERRWNRTKGINWRTQRIVGELLYDFGPEQQDRFVRECGRLSDEQLTRLQQYELTTRDLLSLYPFERGDLRKVPRLFRHLT